MEQYNELLVDACIPIAKFKGSDPAFQLQHTDIVKQDIKDYVAARLNEIDAPRKEAIKAFLTHPAFWFVAIGGSITGVSYIYKWYIER